MSDDEAVIAMVDSNVQREHILPSERAWSLRMKMDAMRRQGSRSDLSTEGTSDTKCRRSETSSIVGMEIGMGQTQVKKYVRLTELIPSFLNMVDNKDLPISMAVEISYFTQEVQEWLYEYHRQNKGIKPAQIKALKELKNIENITKYTFTATMNGPCLTRSIVQLLITNESKIPISLRG